MIVIVWEVGAMVPIVELHSFKLLLLAWVPVRLQIRLQLLVVVRALVQSLLKARVLLFVHLDELVACDVLAFVQGGEDQGVFSGLAFRFLVSEVPIVQVDLLVLLHNVLIWGLSYLRHRLVLQYWEDFIGERRIDLFGLVVFGPSMGWVDHFPLVLPFGLVRPLHRLLLGVLLHPSINQYQVRLLLGEGTFVLMAFCFLLRGRFYEVVLELVLVGDSEVEDHFLEVLDVEDIVHLVQEGRKLALSLAFQQVWLNLVFQ